VYVCLHPSLNWIFSRTIIYVRVKWTLTKSVCILCSLKIKNKNKNNLDLLCSWFFFFGKNKDRFKTCVEKMVDLTTFSIKSDFICSAVSEGYSWVQTKLLKRFLTILLQWFNVRKQTVPLKSLFVWKGLGKGAYGKPSSPRVLHCTIHSRMRSPIYLRPNGLISSRVNTIGNKCSTPDMKLTGARNMTSLKNK